MQRRYPSAPLEILIKDFNTTFGILLQISQGKCPVEDMQLKVKETSPKLWTAPPRVDLALTYNCNNNCYYCYTGGPQKVPELVTANWKSIIDKLWENGVPQVVFTGGEPTLRDDLVELVAHAQAFVTGLVTNGRKLAALAKSLNQAELDYVQVSLESRLPEIHDRMVGVKGAWEETREGIVEALKSDLEVITNTTLTSDNLAVFADLIKYGAELGLKTMACNMLICSGRGTCSQNRNGISTEQLKAALGRALETAKNSGVKLEWYSPTCYKQFNPLEFGLGAKSCSAAAYNLTIEPGGAVIPCQSWFKDKLGDILKDPWPQIWNHPVARDFRERKYLEGRKECRDCEYLPQCYGGCPLEHLP
jgi:radical SAM protein with 4Fe4S-binding SPASM domain